MPERMQRLSVSKLPTSYLNMTLAETIYELSAEHCRSGGLIMGQNLEAVQNVCGTVPIDDPNVQIMPTCEGAGIGMAVGAALTGRPVIHVIRFASFLWMQAAPIVYYAARAKSQWGYDLPLFIRVSSDDGIGPTHSGVYHSPFIHMPGLKVVAPMTPCEYREVWQEFQESRQPVLVSEHRRSYENALEMPPYANAVKPSILIIAISAARFDAIDALKILDQHGIGAELYSIWRLNLDPVDILELYAKTRGKLGVLIVDSGYAPCSIAESIAFRLQSMCVLGNRPEFKVLGMKEPPGVCENGSPSAQEIADAAIEMWRQTSRRIAEQFMKAYQ